MRDNQTLASKPGFIMMLPTYVYIKYYNIEDN